MNDESDLLIRYSVCYHQKFDLDRTVGKSQNEMSY